MRAEKSRTRNRSSGQAHVLGEHQAADELGPASGQAEPDRAAPGVAEDPIPSRPSRSTSPSMIRECDRGRKSYPAAACDRPNPG